jgi:hypothetical protein
LKGSRLKPAMPDCGKKSPPHKGKSTGLGAKFSEDDSWDSAKESARYNAVVDAADWAMREANQCPKGCPFRRLELSIDPIPDPTCRRLKDMKGRRYWDCQVECTWSAIVSCEKRHQRLPVGEDGEPSTAGIDETKRRRLNCDDEASETSSGTGEGYDKDEKKAGAKAKEAAVFEAYFNAAAKASHLRCFLDECPTQRIRLSVGQPSSPTCKVEVEGEHKGEYRCSSDCEYTIVVDCIE